MTEGKRERQAVRGTGKREKERGRKHWSLLLSNKLTNTTSMLNFLIEFIY